MTVDSLKDKVVVITGGSRGIGQAVAEAVIEQGASVVIGDILDSEGEALIKEMNEKAGKKVAAFIHTDVTKYVDNQNLFKLAESEFGGVDYALLNAGIGSNANSMFTPMDDELEERIIDINSTAVIKGTKVALLHMAKRGGGSIVNLASVAGLFSGPDIASYNASKHAVVGYTRSFSLMPHICNVRVNAICPYWVETDLIKSVPGELKETNPFMEYLSKCPRTPMSTVIEGILTFFVDNSKNAECVMALPDGLQTYKFADPPASFRKEGTEEAAKEYYAGHVARSKTALAEALKAYGI